MKLRSLTAAGVAAALLALAGCGGSSDGGSGSSGPVDLRMTIWSANAKHTALFDQIAAAYKKDHPEIGKITFESIPFDSYTTALTTQIGGGNAPDLAWILESTAPDFVTSGALEPIDKDPDLLPSATATWEQDGKLFAYPFSTSPLGVFVNTDLVTAAGRPTPAQQLAAGTWTWDQAVATGAAVRRLRLQGLGHAEHDLGRLGRAAVERGRQELRVRPAADGRRDDVRPQDDLHRQGDARTRPDDRLLRGRRVDGADPDQPRGPAGEGQVQVGPGTAAEGPGR
jgi:hypothetical protein